MKQFVNGKIPPSKLPGFTLVELLVVMAIIGLLIGTAFSALLMFRRNDMRDSARTLNSLLRAARIYAMTYNVEAGVVYSLDYPFSREPDGADVFMPLFDSIFPDPEQLSFETAMGVRVVRAAAVMYQIPSAMNIKPEFPDEVTAGSPNYKLETENHQAIFWSGTFVPAPKQGWFVPLHNGFALHLVEPPNEFNAWAGTPQAAIGVPLYKLDRNLPTYDIRKRNYLVDYDRSMEYWEKWQPTDTILKPSLEKIGMIPVYVYLPPIEAVKDEQGNMNYVFDPTQVRPMLAHVFNPDGSLKTRYQIKERYRMVVAPDPTTAPEERVAVAVGIGGVEVYNAIGVTIEINRATGRVKVVL